MPGTRTAPAVTAEPDYILVSLVWYDWTGDQRTDTYQFDAGATDIQIEAFAAAQQALSNATLWRITRSEVFNSDGDSANALEEVWENAKDNLVFLMKDILNNSMDIFVPAPINAAFIEQTETIDPTNADIVALLTASVAMRTGYAVKSGRFTHRRQIGTKVNI